MRRADDIRVVVEMSESRHFSGQQLDMVGIWSKTTISEFGALRAKETVPGVAIASPLGFLAEHLRPYILC